MEVQKSKSKQSKQSMPVQAERHRPAIFRHKKAQRQSNMQSCGNNQGSRPKERCAFPPTQALVSIHAFSISLHPMIEPVLDALS